MNIFVKKHDIIVQDKDYIQKIDKNKNQIILKNDVELSISYISGNEDVLKQIEVQIVTEKESVFDNKKNIEKRLLTLCNFIFLVFNILLRIKY